MGLVIDMGRGIHRLFSPATAAASALALASLACMPAALDETGKRCSLDRPCGAGFVCSRHGRCLADSSAPGDLLVADAAVWSFLADGSEPPPDWTEAAAAEPEWPRGPAPLGYGDARVQTELPAPADASRPLATYFFTRFEVVDPTRYASLELELLRDDGAIVFLNGREVARSNLPAGAVGPLTAASFEATAVEPARWTLDISSLVAGTNLIAVELHQFSANSPDALFELALVGYR